MNGSWLNGHAGARHIRTSNTYRREAQRRAKESAQQDRRMEAGMNGFVLAIAMILLILIVIGVATHLYTLVGWAAGCWIAIYWVIQAMHKDVK
jgi:hypothetical protein